jgi:hypothetical protein
LPAGTYVGDVIADVHDDGAVVNALDGIVRLSLEPGTTRYLTAGQARALAVELGRAAAATDGVEVAMMVKKHRRVGRKNWAAKSV